MTTTPAPTQELNVSQQAALDRYNMAVDQSNVTGDKDDALAFFRAASSLLACVLNLAAEAGITGVVTSTEFEERIAAVYGELRVPGIGLPI